MRWLVLLAAAWIGAGPAAADGEEPLPGGTLLFLENCNSVVQWTTRGDIAHVALLLPHGAEASVYEATPGKVRRVEFGDYLAELARLNARRSADQQIRLHAVRPVPEYSAGELATMRTYLEAQLGRRYSVKNYLRGQPYDGIHCAELAATTLNQSGRHHFHDCHKIHPQALYSAVTATPGSTTMLPVPSWVESESWFSRVQKSWFAWLVWCRWSSREAWLFLW